MKPLVSTPKPEYLRRGVIPLCPDPTLLVLAWCRGKREVWQTGTHALEIFRIYPSEDNAAKS